VNILHPARFLSYLTLEKSYKWRREIVREKEKGSSEREREGK